MLEWKAFIHVWALYKLSILSIFLMNQLWKSKIESKIKIDQCEKKKKSRLFFVMSYDSQSYNQVSDVMFICRHRLGFFLLWMWCVFALCWQLVVTEGELRSAYPLAWRYTVLILLYRKNEYANCEIHSLSQWFSNFFQHNPFFLLLVNSATHLNHMAFIHSHNNRPRRLQVWEPMLCQERE